jgi:subfamily B ATP-binding cassette protein MsbA
MDSSSAVYKRLLGYIKKAKLAFIIAILGNLVYAAMEATFVWFFKPLIDDVFVPGEIDAMKIAPLVIIVILLIRGIAAVISTYCMSWVGQKVVQSLREQLVQSYMALPVRFFDQNASGNLVSKVTFNVQQVANASSDAITKLAREGGLIIFLVSSLFYLSWRLACIYFISIPIIAIIVKITSKRFKKVSKGIQDAMGDVTQSSQEIVEGYKVVKTYNGESFEQAKFNHVVNRNRQQNLKLILVKAISVPVIQLIAGIALGVVIYFGTIEYAEGRVTGGDLTVILATMMMMLKPLKILSNINMVLQQGIAAAQDVFAILDSQKEIDKGNLKLNHSPTKIAFKGVTFGYEQNNQVLNNISFELEKGKTVALVGRSGSGKSTITNLLLRFYQPDSGSIEINNSSIDEFSLESLRGNIAYVSQQVILFSDSIRANIAYADENIDEEKLIDAARKAHALEFIEKLEGGFDYLVGENGNRLSGGQRQRIAIARAIYKDAPIIILDEATSALDTESERHIQAALDELTKERTTLVIAHRLSTIENADKIIVMQDGEIVEQGTHQALLEKNQVYSALHAKGFSDKESD